MKRIFTALLVLFSCVMVVNADETCSYQEELELREKASNIKVSFDMNSEVYKDQNDSAGIVSDGRNFYTISVTNIIPEFYITVTNDLNDKEFLLTSSSQNNGVSTFEWDDIDNVANHVFKVTASTNTNCSGIVLKTIRFQTPRYNKYYWRCADEFPDYYLCQKFITTKEEFNEYEFFQKLDEHREKVKKEELEKEKNKNFFEKLIDFLGKNKWIILGVIIVIAVGGYTFYYFKTKKQRDLGL